MVIKIFSVRDNKTGEHDKIFTSANETIATRSFALACGDKRIQLGLFPADYDLMFLGTFDTTTGKIKSEDPTFIVSGISAAKMVEHLNQGNENGNDPQ